MTLSHEELFLRYLHAGAISRDPDAVAALFTEDGVYEAPLQSLRFTGRPAIRDGVAALHRRLTTAGILDAERSGYILHETLTPDVFIAEIDTVLTHPDGPSTTVALTQIFRVHKSHITLLRDYFQTP
ncbi:nuclear transport factor 2 family protein [Actinoplanes rectilineatus]|uniref:nuclear transport factor 2 family protein n=1 Tax=Actinoplanes rectilineatus TaxID=113571 RepID=UPI0005F2951F|nr:nuclear transport factor 2 family protein [Actinoplanes rectilineatus]